MAVRINGFSPPSVSINVHETVYFVVMDDNAPYCIQSYTGAWTPWYLWEYGDGFGIQINEPGDYYYRDIFTYNSGVIHVGTGTTNLPPSETITSPEDGAVLTEPASFTFAATVTDLDSGVSAVEFYVGANLIDTLYSAPYSTQVTNLAAGNYTLTAIAYDNASATTSRSVNITVQPRSPPTITVGPPRLIAGQFEFDVTGLISGKQAVLQSSPSLGSTATWTSLLTNAVTSPTVPFSTPVLPGTRFFRVVQLP